MTEISIGGNIVYAEHISGFRKKAEPGDDGYEVIVAGWPEPIGINAAELKVIRDELADRVKGDKGYVRCDAASVNDFFSKPENYLI